MGKFIVVAAVATVTLLTLGVVRRRERFVAKVFIGAALASAALLGLGTLLHEESLGAASTVGLVLSLIALASLAQWRAKQAKWHAEMMEEALEPDQGNKSKG